MTLVGNISRQFQITIIMVTHNMDQYKFGSRIINMVDGKITSDTINQQFIGMIDDDTVQQAMQETSKTI
jgi:ABC-type uncharacterized transport system ATPase component